MKEAAKVHVPIDSIRVIKGSKRTAHSNAYVVGIGKYRKIVLYDTLIEKHNNKEIVAIVNHELGHAKYRHLIWRFVYGAV